ncbi:MAG: TIGR03617 family F420-dependent LLM class oxidoreductase [bacterium]|nr:LLM class F420-dependent oxidoreductase [Deltaproteobacteria bacterium]MCP4908869.1 TIGR03617 family F420-dependent LLM class oxidoreductase [bacterium]
MFRVWASLGVETPLSDIGEHARRAEEMGFEGVVAPDVMSDGFLVAQAAILATTRIRVGTSALVCFPRSPMTTGVAAWNLQALSEGRFHLGLGPLVRGNIIGKYSTPWTPPAPRMREYVGSLHALFDCWQNGTRLDYRGEHYQFTRMQDFVKPPPIEHPDIPIHLAGIGPNMTALAGELGDALMTHPTNAAPDFVRDITRPRLAVGGERTGRKPEETSLFANPLIATGRDEQAVAARREEHRELMAILYSTPSYWPSLDYYGWRDRGERLHGLVRENRWSDLTPLMTDEMLDITIPSATWDGLGALLTQWYAGVADGFLLAIPEDPVDDEALSEVVAELRGI